MRVEENPIGIRQTEQVDLEALQANLLGTRIVTFPCPRPNENEIVRYLSLGLLLLPLVGVGMYLYCKHSKCPSDVKDAGMALVGSAMAISTIGMVAACYLRCKRLSTN